MKKRLIVSGILLAGLMLATYAFANQGFASETCLRSMLRILPMLHALK